MTIINCPRHATISRCGWMRRDGCSARQRRALCLSPLTWATPNPVISRNSSEEKRALPLEKSAENSAVVFRVIACLIESAFQIVLRQHVKRVEVGETATRLRATIRCSRFDVQVLKKQAPLEKFAGLRTKVFLEHCFDGRCEGVLHIYLSNSIGVVSFSL